MITNDVEYQHAREELTHFESWLDRSQGAITTPKSGLTRTGILKMIARIQEELGMYEAGMSVAATRSEGKK